MKYLYKIFVTSIAISLLLTGIVSAGEQNSDRDGVQTIGTATREVEPDTAFINMAVETKAETANAAKTANAKVMEAIMKNLKSFGIKEKNIKTTGYSLSQHYKQDGKNRSIPAGYILVHNLNVKVEDINKTGSVIDTMLIAGANQFNGVLFTISNREKIERDLLIEATKNAKEKAEIVAIAGGRQLGKLLRASVGSVGGRFENNVRDTGMLKSFTAAELSPATQITAGTLSISATVDATFELK